MSQQVRSSIATIFAQLFIALIAFSVLAAVASASTLKINDSKTQVLTEAPAQTNLKYLTQFKSLDASTRDRQLEGRMRASIAFDRRFAIHDFKVSAKQGQLFINGQVANPLLIEELKALALHLVSAEQLVLDVKVVSVHQETAAKSAFDNLLAFAF